jgi:hypothetical protein
VIDMPAPKLTTASISNALKAVALSGRPISAMTLQPDGSMRIEFFGPDTSDAANVNPAGDTPKKWGQRA